MTVRLALIATGLVLALPAQAMDLNASIIVAPQVATGNRASPYFVGPPIVSLPDRTSRQDLELRAREGGFNAQGTLRWQVAQDAKPEYHGIANQFYYDGELGEGMGFTAGKKVMSWGVGFGFRPLDLIQRENRRGVNLPALVGQPLLAVEKFNADEAWTLAWVRPGEGGGSDDNRDPALAFHWYRLAGGDDLHAVARLSQRHGIEAGFGATRVVGDEWSFHGAALYERHYRKTINSMTETGGLLATTDPMAEATRQDGLKLVAGAQWTGESGWSVLAEAWYDADAYSRAEWQRLDALTASQRALAGLAPAAAIAGNVGWSSQAYLNTNLLRENLLLRVGHDDRDGFKPYAELLATPRDGGLVLTVGTAYEGNRQRLSGGLRQSGGANDSAYARAPIKRVIWLEWRLALF
ncbi:MAG TPA: hypothetical protein VFF82_07055 [Rhodocyclaceae bacterium]|nr:hypothetical protein [Rhodocyclaceae bacterium]